jgi:hypothetical protein
MQSLLDPAVLFFVFGVAAGLVRSNLAIPAEVSRFLSLYLLMALGLKGGFALAKSGLTADVAVTICCALALAVIVPAIGYQVLRRLVSGFDAVAISATYGSVSAVTFITATQYLDGRGVAYGGHMAAALALMESPAIIMAVIVANSMRRSQSVPAAASLSGGAATVPGSSPGAGMSLGKILHESFTDGAQLLLLGSMAIGLATGEAGKAAMQPFSGDLFKGMLAFFLLDMGLMAARNLGELRGRPPTLLAYAVLAPVAHASLALALAMLVGLSPGDGALLMVLAASASYIAVPAVLRYAVPEANPSLYFGMSLGVTFPLNILLGIPVYSGVASLMLG